MMSGDMVSVPPPLVIVIPPTLTWGELVVLQGLFFSVP